QSRAGRIRRLRHPKGALSLIRHRGFFCGHIGRSGSPELRDRDLRSGQRAALRRLPSVHLPRRSHLLLRADPRGDPDGAGLRFVVGADQGLAAVPGTGVYVHGDVRTWRYREPHHDELAGRRIRAVQAAVGQLFGTGRDRADRVARCRGNDRDGLSPEAQCRPRPRTPLPGRHAGCAGPEQLVRLGLRHAHRPGPVRSDAPPLRAAMGRDPGIHRERDEAQGVAMSAVPDSISRADIPYSARTGASSVSQLGAMPPYALELKDLRKSFGKTEIIRGASLAVNAGERIAVIGPNGAGKSTLFNLISGRFAPTSGEVLLNGHRIDGKRPFEINRLGLSRSFQITNIFPKLSVFENLRCGVLW